LSEKSSKVQPKKSSGIPTLNTVTRIKNATAIYINIGENIYLNPIKICRCSSFNVL
jgi:hypothetical protein